MRTQHTRAGVPWATTRAGRSHLWMGGLSLVLLLLIIVAMIGCGAVGPTIRTGTDEGIRVENYAASVARSIEYADGTSSWETVIPGGAKPTNIVLDSDGVNMQGADPHRVLTASMQAATWTDDDGITHALLGPNNKPIFNYVTSIADPGDTSFDTFIFNNQDGTITLTNFSSDPSATTRAQMPAMLQALVTTGEITQAQAEVAKARVAAGVDIFTALAEIGVRFVAPVPVPAPGP